MPRVCAAAGALLARPASMQTPTKQVTALALDRTTRRRGRFLMVLLGSGIVEVVQAPALLVARAAGVLLQLGARRVLEVGNAQALVRAQVADLEPRGRGAGRQRADRRGEVEPPELR